MSDRFQDEYPIYLSRKLCRDVGVDGAIFLQQLRWLLREDANNGRVIQGKRWIYNTVDEWRQKYFDFYSKRTLERLISKLEKDGFLESCQPEGKKSRRKYYRLPDDIEKRIDDHTAKVAGSIPPKWRVPLCNNSYDNNSLPEEKKCPPPSQARSSDDVSLSREEAIDLSTKLIQSLKTDSGGEAHAPGRENSDSARATNCVTSVTFERRLPKVQSRTMPSSEWFDSFCEEYSPLWAAWMIQDYVLKKNRYRAIHDMEKYLAAFFEKLENDRTTPR